ncbi:kinase-like protein [Aspergillus indologenus CBS 114.80]|uniref:Kinase-like protein n=1 Tax=Aspergillus indologenus CBS 114.80 TaxID=1450541 RepID=A0A2V5JDM7_9EURO|nr:kinase-like protein [Aspergillus indologenus CBS 114.80]
MENPYPSTLRLLCTTGDRSVWQVGTDKILKEYPSDDALCTEGAVMRVLAQDPEIPAPRVLHEWVDSNGRYFILEERLRGETLQDAWPRLSQPQKRAIAAQVGQVRQRLRRLTSPCIQSVGGGACYPPYEWGFRTRAQGPFGSDADLRAAIRSYLAGLLDRELPDQILQNLMARMPASGPYVLTHGDLHISNIMVDADGRLVGIIDWEYAAYYPIWFEYLLVARGNVDPDNAEWKELLLQQFEDQGDGHPDAVQFRDHIFLLKGYPYLDDGERELLAKLCSGQEMKRRTKMVLDNS